MATFILTWNPEYETDEEAQHVPLLISGEESSSRWSFSTRKRGVEKGDRAFMLLQGAERGIVAAGGFTTRIRMEPHWDGSGRECGFAAVAWDGPWLPTEERLPTEGLVGDVPGVKWNALRGSGVQAQSPADTQLEAVWSAHLASLGKRS